MISFWNCIELSEMKSNRLTRYVNTNGCLITSQYCRTKSDDNKCIKYCIKTWSSMTSKCFIKYTYICMHIIIDFTKTLLALKRRCEHRYEYRYKERNQVGINHEVYTG